MKLGIYSIRDAKTEQYNTPIFTPNDATAVRMFKNEVNRADNLNGIYLNPEDFSLYLLGEYDTDTGGLTPLQDPKLLVRAETVRKD